MKIARLCVVFADENLIFLIFTTVTIAVDGFAVAT